MFMPELLPCAFCGHVPSIEDFRKETWQGICYQAICSKCNGGLTGIWIVSKDDNETVKDKCINSWNTRYNEKKFSTLELKPCPFCGSEVKIQEHSKACGHASTCGMGGFTYTHTETNYSIICGKDGCWLSMARHYTNREKMINEWNQRANIN
jgi:hypothetical protein